MKIVARVIHIIDIRIKKDCKTETKEKKGTFQDKKIVEH